MKRLPATLLALLLLAAPAMADVVKTVSTKYYKVQGTTPAAIFADLQSKSPLNKGNKTYQANTQTNIKYSYTWEKQGNKCTIKEVKVFLHLTYLYPRLVRSVDGKTRKWWKKFLAKLEEHELIHGEISIKAAHELSDTLEAIKSGDCINFKALVKNRANRVLKQLKKDQVAYDKLTQHGLKQERNRGRYP